MATALLLLGAAVAHAASGDLERAETSAPDALAQARQVGTLTVAVVADNPPFAFNSPRTGALQGFDVDLAEALGERLGLAVNVEAAPLEEIPGMVLRGDVHIALVSSARPAEWPDTLHATNPYHFSELALLALAGTAGPNVESLAALNRPRPDGERHVVAVTIGGAAAPFVETELPGAVRRTYGDAPDAVRALLAGDVDAVADRREWLDSFRRQYARADATAVLTEPLARLPFAAWVHPNQQALLTAVNETLEDLRSDGILADRRQFYMDNEDWRARYDVPFTYMDGLLSDRIEWLGAIVAVVATAVLLVVFVTFIVYTHRASRRAANTESAGDA